MSKRTVRVLLVVTVMVLTALSFVLSANAASASLWFSDPTVTVGSNVSVVVDVKGSDIGGYQVNISYDTTYLTFISASGNSGNFTQTNSPGVVRVVDYLGSGSASKMSFTLTFKTLKTGTTKLTPSEYNFSSGSADSITPGAIGDSTIKIVPVPEASSDATLSSLSISGGTLTPAFNANTTEYTALVDFSVESLAVSAIKNHTGASVYVSGNETLIEGENTVTVTVTAENGAQKVYTIKVTRGKNPLSTGLTATLSDGVTSEIANAISQGMIPAGFEITKIKINDIEIDALLYDERALPVVYLLGSDSLTSGLYYINVGDMTVKPFDWAGNTVTWINIIDINLTDAPEGYEIGKFMFDETEREVFIPKGVEEVNHCLVYAIGANGEKSLYMYDPLDKSYQRYGFAQLGKEAVKDETTEKSETNKQPEQTNEQNEQEKDGLFSDPVFLWSFMFIAVLIVVLIIVGIVLTIKNRT